MAKYRKKPVVIEAVHYGANMGVIPDWLQAGFDNNTVRRSTDYGHTRRNDGPTPLKILTLEGIMTCKQGDWIIKGVEGELYPCADSIFTATYEKVEE